MTAVTPDSNIRLLKCPIKLDDHNQITFASLSAQTTYFQSLPYLTDSNMTYIRKDGVIRVGTSSVDYEDLLGYNYCMYHNTHYDSKWFYAYITDVKYVNDGMTEISIETDVFQTWQFASTFQTSFIEREHVNDDTVGLHTVPENLEHGEYICVGSGHITQGDVVYIIGATTKADGSIQDGTSPRLYTDINGIPYQGFIYVFNSKSSLANVLQSYVTQSHADNIYGVWTASRFAIYGDVPNSKWDGDSSPVVLLQSHTKPTSLNGYTPVNKKVLTYPYRYLLMSNNVGQANILKYEGWSGTSCSFQESYCATVGGDTKLIPYNYFGQTTNEEEGISGGKYPTLSWSKDLFTNWMSQNAVNIGIGQASSGLAIVGGIAMIATGAGAGVGAGMIAGGIGGIASTMGQVYQHEFDPRSARGNTASSGINVAGNTKGFYLYDMSIKNEYAKIIDNFFEVYGYKVNRIGTPHIHVRTYWDYCKTIDVHISGNIPEQDMIKLRALFNNGCTFWHDTSHFMDYSLTNSIIT